MSSCGARLLQRGVRLLNCRGPCYARLVAVAPAVEGNKLYLSEIAGKSDWSNPATKMTTSNPEVHRLYGRVANYLKQVLSFTVTATNEVTGKSGRYNDIGYTEGARNWLKNAGEWRQEAVRNILYDVE